MFLTSMEYSGNKVLDPVFFLWDGIFNPYPHQIKIELLF